MGNFLTTDEHFNLGNSEETFESSLQSNNNSFNLHQMSEDKENSTA